MTKVPGMGDNLYVGGYNISGDIASLDRIAGGPAAMVMTDITQSAYDRVGGQRDGGIDATTWFNKDTGCAHPTLSALPTTDTLVSYLRGTAIGSWAACLVAKQVGYDMTRAADGAVTFKVSAVGNQYGLEWGQQLTAGVRTDTTGTNGATLDGAASSSVGAQFYLQVFSVTGTSVTVTIEDSANGTDWTALSGMAFTAAAGVTWQRIATASGATVRRYLRATTSGTFTDAQFTVVAVRNQVAVAF